MRRVKVKEVDPEKGHWEYRKWWLGIKVADKYIKEYKEYEGWLHDIKNEQYGGITGDGPYMSTRTQAIVEDDNGYMHKVSVTDIQFLDKPINEE